MFLIVTNLNKVCIFQYVYSCLSAPKGKICTYEVNECNIRNTVPYFRREGVE